MDVSIIIVSWNTRAILCNCLRSIYRETAGVSFEVFVIDNASIDGSAGMVTNEFGEAIVIENLENRGFGAANNQGIRIAKGRYILLLNSDTIVLDNAIGKAVRFADSQPMAGVVGCKVLNPDRSLQRSCFMFPSVLNMVLSASYLYKLFGGSRFFGRERMTWWDENDVREVDTVMGCFMLVWREAINQVGVMDERFFMYGEETDWCYRFKMCGWKVMFTPNAEIIHIGQASSVKRASDMTLQLRGAILQFADKHFTRARYLAAYLLTGFFFGSRIPFWFLKTIVNAENRAVSWSKVVIYSKGLVRLLAGGRAICLKSGWV